MPRLALVLFVMACNGPEVSDAVLCQDVIQRLCAGPRCSLVDSKLNPGADCTATLLARTGCGADDFTFTTPTRNRVLECRIPLVRLSARRDVPPGCDNAGEVLISCPDLVTYLGGTP